MSKTIEIDVEVTEQDILSGARCKARSCPLALAIHRSLPNRESADYVAVLEGMAEFLRNGIYFLATLPPVAAHFVELFDGGNRVNPFSFKLTFSEVL